jgi:hypothetical protein
MNGVNAACARTSRHRQTYLRLPTTSWCFFLGLAIALVFSPSVRADSNYYRHVFFDTSLTTNSYFYSLGRVSGPSKLALENGKVPVENVIFFTPPNALRFEWQSNANGGWEATVRVVDFRNRHPVFLGDTLFFWVYSTDQFRPPNCRCFGCPTLERIFQARCP